MKYYFILLMLVVGLSATAQYYPDGSQHIGVDRRLTGQRDHQKKNRKQPDKEEKFEMSMQKLTQDLALDSFQAAVIQQLFEANRKEEEKVIIEDIPNESKLEKIISLREAMNAKIKEILSPSQIEMFNKLGKQKKK